jgi:sirohydrochlorin cobaltochelatase
VRRVHVLPLFFAGGAHVARDIPEQVSAVRDLFPDVSVEILSPIGEHRRFRILLKVLAQEAALDAQTARQAAES